MLRKLWGYITGHLQIKLTLLMGAVILSLLGAYMWYGERDRQQVFDDAQLAKAKSMAISGAEATAHVLEDALASQRLTEAQLFDTNYQIIPGSSPAKYHTQYDTFTDANLQRINDAYLQEDKDVLYAVASDINGYVPTHNTISSQPLTGDYQTDLTGNRTKRIFNDLVGLAAAKNTQPTLFQTYLRDNLQTGWDVSAPIYVNGRHWGGFRVALSLERLAAAKAELTQRTLLGGIAFAVIVLTVLYLVVRSTIRPILALSQAATKVAGGDFNQSVPVKSHDEIGVLAVAFNSMTLQLRELVRGLEQRVAQRTQQLEERSTELAQRSNDLENLNQQLQATSHSAERRAAQLAASAQVARAVGRVRNLDELLTQVAALISNAFGFYHVGIFIIDEFGQFAVLRAANSAGGQRMLERDHKLGVGQQGIVGYVTGSGRPRIALDVGTDAVHFNNPDLPETHSELALPLQVGGQTFGALDVQSILENAFSEEDVATLGTLADQIAIAIDNTRLFAQTQAALHEAEELNRRYVREEWEQLLPTLDVTSHEYRASGVPSIGNTPQPEMEDALHTGEVVMSTRTGDAATASAVAVPIKLRGQVVGTIDLQDPAAARNWTADEIAILTAVADQAGLALENVRLIEETERSAQREKAVADAADKIHRSTDIETVLQSAISELNRITGRRGISVQLGFGTTRPSEGNGHGTAPEGDR